MEACSSSSSPIDSPLAIGSFLEQRSRQLFRATVQGQNEEKQEEEEEPQSPSPSQDVEEATVPTGGPEAARADQAPASQSHRADLDLDVRQRCELSIMDYDETLPDY